MMPHRSRPGLRRALYGDLARRQQPDEDRTRDADGSPLARMVTEIGRAARAGWAQTARLIALLTVAAGAAALILWTSRKLSRSPR
jgi:hypothetical protein